MTFPSALTLNLKKGCLKFEILQWEATIPSDFQVFTRGLGLKSRRSLLIPRLLSFLLSRRCSLISSGSSLKETHFLDRREATFSSVWSELTFQDRNVISKHLLTSSTDLDRNLILMDHEGACLHLFLISMNGSILSIDQDRNLISHKDATLGWEATFPSIASGLTMSIRESEFNG